MFERNVYDQYKLYCEDRFKLGGLEGFTMQNKHYFLVCVDGFEIEELTDMVKMGNHLQVRGDHEIATFIPTVTNALTSFVDGQNCVMFQLPGYYSRSKKEKSLGFELARLHNRGKTYSKGKKEHANWTKFWIDRLSQLDLLYGNITKQTNKSSFDQAFIISFPYYLGRTENAIQYIVDSNIDFNESLQREAKTICHVRFSEQTWLTIDSRTKAAVKSPIEFVYDYPSRDLAEMIRTIGDQNDEPFDTVTKFINDYQTVEEISRLSWRYIYGRLLFPIDYFQIVEGYYRSVDDFERDNYLGRIFDLLRDEQKTESFLREFPNQIISTFRQDHFPRVDWLSDRGRSTDYRSFSPYFNNKNNIIFKK